MHWRHAVQHRAVLGAGAFVLADAITGMAAYCLITLSALWYFSYSWIRLVDAFALQGQRFGSDLQLQLAWVGVFAAIPAMAVVVVLAILAYRLPIDLARRMRRPVDEQRRPWFGRRTRPG